MLNLNNITYIYKNNNSNNNDNNNDHNLRELAPANPGRSFTGGL